MLANTRQKGFTLVEILIVVVILGILAAIVIPQFTSASETAKLSSVKSQLQTIRSQLELYRNQHGGGYPALSTNWDAMTTESGGFGPYLQAAPSNPFENSTTVGTAAAGVGWVYDSSTGAIQAVMENAKQTELGVDADADFAGYDA
jgi:general secretion pathway protein G